jgi:hypothetical protein
VSKNEETDVIKWLEETNKKSKKKDLLNLDEN